MVTKQCKHNLALEVVFIRVLPSVCLIGLIWILYSSIENLLDVLILVIAILAYVCVFYWGFRRFKSGQLILKLEDEGFYYNYLRAGLVSHMHFVSWADVSKVQWLKGASSPGFIEIILRSSDSLFKPAYGWVKLSGNQQPILIFSVPLTFKNIQWVQCINEYLDRFMEQLNKKAKK